MDNTKWYESPLVDESVVISARVRFARNFEQYPFPVRLDDAHARVMAAETANAVLSAKGDEFRYFDISDNPPESLIPMMERHLLEKNREYAAYQKTVRPLFFMPRKNNKQR